MAKEGSRERVGAGKRWLKWFGALAAILVVAWAFFRPDKQAHIEEASPTVVATVQSMLPEVRAPKSGASISYLETRSGQAFTRRQKVDPVSPTAIRRSTKVYNRANELGVVDESSSISIGPFILVSHYREPLPLIGDLLPNAFWQTRLLQRVEAKPAQDFPRQVGSALDADLWTEERYSTGEPARVIQSKLNCVAIERADAKVAVDSQLSGNATRVKCVETNLTQSERKVTTTSESWFVEDLPLMIAISNDETIVYDVHLPPISRSSVRKLESLSLKGSAAK